GFLSAFLNTLFFTTTLVILFGQTDYIMGMRGGKNVLAFMVAFVGINAVFEMLASTLITGAVGNALYKAKAIK
ncbi:MAG: ECF transporter S component, partial [Clostridia bacterium]|nr:ECF transporter S component [Clostridia bacterium]